MFEYKTRGGVSPRGKQKIYFSCHPDDREALLAEYSDLILKAADCALWFDSSEDAYEDPETDLGGMSLFVIPVTKKLLTGTCRTITADLPFAEKKHIPILPLMTDRGLEELYNKRFGGRHFLDPNENDPTALSFDEKLEGFLRSVIVGSELAEKVRAAFSSYVFISYRKKDRRYAGELMRLIHANASCESVAVWYDEFLVPGEDFGAAISDALKKSGLFALVVTPNLVSEDNYVRSVEYPEAVKEGKIVLAAEMAATDPDKLNRCFPDIGSAVKREDIPELVGSYFESTGALKGAHGACDPVRDHLLGLAYLGGIDLEKDPELAQRLITSAAEAGLPDAVKKLAVMYENGEGVARDNRVSLMWQKKYVELCRERADAERSLEALTEHLEAITALGRKHVYFGEYEEAVSCFESMNAYSAGYAGIFPGLERYVGGSLLSAGDIFLREMHDLGRADECFRRALFIAEKLSKEGESESSRMDLAGCYDRLGVISEERGDLENAEQYYLKSLGIREEAVRLDDSFKNLFSLSLSYERLSDVAELRWNTDVQEEYAVKCLSIRRRLADESDGASYLHPLIVILSRLCIVNEAARDYADEKKYAAELVEAAEGALKKSDSVLNSEDLAQGYYRLAKAEHKLREYDASEKDYLRAVGIVEGVVSVTGTVRSRRSLSIYLTCLGDLRLERGDRYGAAEAYDLSYDIAAELYRETQSRKELDRLAVASYHKAEVREPKDASMLEESYRLFCELAESFPGVMRYVRNRDSIKEELDSAES